MENEEQHTEVSSQSMEHKNSIMDNEQVKQPAGVKINKRKLLDEIVPGNRSVNAHIS